MINIQLFNFSSNLDCSKFWLMRMPRIEISSILYVILEKSLLLVKKKAFLAKLRLI